MTLVKEVMSQHVLTAQKDENIIDIARRMLKQDVKLLVVIEDSLTKKPIGVITHMDIIEDVIIKKKDAETTKVDEIMCEEIIGTTPETAITDALEKMKEHHVKRLPVIDDTGSLIGILSNTDIMKQFLEYKKKLVEFADSF